jgi:hypothetical protein
MDSYQYCLDKDHFLTYPHTITYQYNSRGLRDQEWPDSIEELNNAVWCIGDSFTVGIGSPAEHCWTHILEKKINRRVINVSMDGASNEWIARRAVDICNTIAPKNMVIMWSYFNRREDPDVSKLDEDRRIFCNKNDTSNDDRNNFIECFNKVNINCNNTTLCHLTIPHTTRINVCSPSKLWDDIKGPDWPSHHPRTLDDFYKLDQWIIDELIEHTVYNDWIQLIGDPFFKNCFFSFDTIITVPQLDVARDGHHFDMQTSCWVVDKVVNYL